MKSLSLPEIAQIAISSQDLVGAHIQDALQTPTELGLGFYFERESVWLWLDLNPQAPMLARFKGRAPKRKKVMRPLTLFLRSNFFGRRLASVRADLERGRILILSFSRSKEEEAEDPGPCEIEIRLFPRGQNVIARTGKRSVAEIKPKDLAVAGQTTFGESFLHKDEATVEPEFEASGESKSNLKFNPKPSAKSNSSSQTSIDTIRTWDELSEAWLSEQKQPVTGQTSGQTSGAAKSSDREVLDPHSLGANLNSSPNSNPNSSLGLSAGAQEAARILKDFERALQKKQKALERMHEEVQAKKSEAETFRQVGDQLKLQGTLEAPRTEPWVSLWSSHVDLKKSLSWNIENTFTKAKERRRKLSGTEERLRIVEKELSAIRDKGPTGFVKNREKSTREASANLLSKSDAKGRRLQLGEGLEVYIGKSAADNLALLRRAQSFDYWLHLRDQPGSHAIMRRGRNRTVTDQEFFEAGQWVIEQSLGSRAAQHKGERFDLLIVECRFVKPIKGDRLGRVNYSNDRVLSVRF